MQLVAIAVSIVTDDVTDAGRIEKRAEKFKKDEILIEQVEMNTNKSCDIYAL